MYLVSSADAAEATKLYENIFRAVSLALANEFADACGALGLDPIEVTLAAGTKPYGFLGVFPGPGVGGHCIPCDPHYLLWQLDRRQRPAPLIEQAMRSIAERPDRVADRAGELLAEGGVAVAGARVIVIGVAYKAGVRDLRESPALPLIAGLRRRAPRSPTTTRWSRWCGLDGGQSWPACRPRTALTTTWPSCTRCTPVWITPGRATALGCWTPPTSSTARRTAQWSEAADMTTFPAAAPDTSTPAVVLKFDQNVMHHGSLGVIRSLGRLGVPVYGVHEGPWAPAASSRYLPGPLDLAPGCR